MDWRSSFKDVLQRNVGDGNSGKSSYFPGKTGCAPKTGSTGKNSASSLEAEEISRMTHGGWLCQVERAEQARRASLCQSL